MDMEKTNYTCALWKRQPRFQTIRKIAPIFGIMGSVHSPVVKSAVNVNRSTSCSIPQSLEPVICYTPSLVSTILASHLNMHPLLSPFCRDRSWTPQPLPRCFSGLAGNDDGGPGLEGDDDFEISDVQNSFNRSCWGHLIVRVSPISEMAGG